MTKNRLSFAGSQTLLASENEFNSRGKFNSAETVGDARRLKRLKIGVIKSKNLKKCKNLDRKYLPLK